MIFLKKVNDKNMYCIKSIYFTPTLKYVLYSIKHEESTGVRQY